MNATHLLVGASVVLTLAGCSASGPSATLPPGATHGGNAGSGGGSGTVTFTLQVNLTGADPEQGSFTDAETGSGFSSCSQYANDTNTGAGWVGPGRSQQNNQVSGKAVLVLMGVAQGAYHGPGTYAGAVSQLSIGSDDFYGGSSSVTVNGDGSGTATLTNLGGPLANGTESGTISWTCAG